MKKYNIRVEFTGTEAQWISSLIQSEINQLGNAITQGCGNNETAKNLLRLRIENLADIKNRFDKKIQSVGRL